MGEEEESRLKSNKRVAQMGILHTFALLLSHMLKGIMALIVVVVGGSTLLVALALALVRLTISARTSLHTGNS